MSWINFSSLRDVTLPLYSKGFFLLLVKFLLSGVKLDARNVGQVLEHVTILEINEYEAKKRFFEVICHLSNCRSLLVRKKLSWLRCTTQSERMSARVSCCLSLVLRSRRAKSQQFCLSTGFLPSP